VKTPVEYASGFVFTFILVTVGTAIPVCHGSGRHTVNRLATGGLAQNGMARIRSD
jgi:hypothetical protein